MSFLGSWAEGDGGHWARCRLQALRPCPLCESTCEVTQGVAALTSKLP